MSSSVTTTFNAWLGRPPFTSLLFLVTKLAAIGEFLMSTTCAFSFLSPKTANLFLLCYHRKIRRSILVAITKVINIKYFLKSLLAIMELETLFIVYVQNMKLCLGHVVIT